MPEPYFLLSPFPAIAMGAFFLWLGWTIRRPIVTRRGGRRRAPTPQFVGGAVFFALGVASLLSGAAGLIRAWL